ncbi:HNRNPH1 [Cordylochernes scorpioides]|uniref:HNRNPH1 n=1 Tax=Cordylochernes scorpioides TaxID=51811 RepID=A0ABY6KU97_9ARAC|nr:HNRNPH1 [Cordylochernes scorpioides]
MSSHVSGFILRVRGLPWAVTTDEIREFFGSCNVTAVHLIYSQTGRPTGEAYVEMSTREDWLKGLDRNKKHIGQRYIEIFKSKKAEMDWVLARNSANKEGLLNDGCVRLRGLPFGCSKEEIVQFFNGLEIVPNGITLPTDYQGRPTGEGYVQFASREIAEKALEKHKERIGHRYIEIFRSSLYEIRKAMGTRKAPPALMPFLRTPVFLPSTGGIKRWRWVHLSGVPMEATERDVAEFLRPSATPLDVRLLYGPGGRPTGEADVLFRSHEEAAYAVAHHRYNMEQLYMDSSSGDGQQASYSVVKV